MIKIAFAAIGTGFAIIAASPALTVISDHADGFRQMLAILGG